MEKQSVEHDETVKVVEVSGNPDLASILANAKPNPWGKGYLRMYLCCALIFLCSTMNGK